MKAIILAVSILTVANPVVWADDAHHPDATSKSKAVSAKKASGMDMKKMHEHMQTMQAQMDKLNKATDPEEREKLLQEHTRLMNEHMKMMHNMNMMHATPKDKHIAELAQRLDLLQKMVDQLVKHQHERNVNRSNRPIRN